MGDCFLASYIHHNEDFTITTDAWMGGDWIRLPLHSTIHILSRANIQYWHPIRLIHLCLINRTSVLPSRSTNILPMGRSRHWQPDGRRKHLRDVRRWKWESAGSANGEGHALPAYAGTPPEGHYGGRTVFK